MKIVYLAILFTLSVSGISQNISETAKDSPLVIQNPSFVKAYNKSNLSNFDSVKDVDTAISYAKQDINNESCFLFLPPSGAPIFVLEDTEFEKKYDLHFYDPGCTGSKYYVSYNNVVFDYLYMKYGEKWIDEIRKDVIGLESWKKTLNYKK